jgi:RNA polymerase sigma-70 factor (ECF subfamily)
MRRRVGLFLLPQQVGRGAHPVREIARFLVVVRLYKQCFEGKLRQSWRCVERALLLAQGLLRCVSGRVYPLPLHFYQGDLGPTGHYGSLPEMHRSSRRNRHASVSNPGREETGLLDSNSLATVVTACQKGDRAAFRQLYDSCHNGVFRLAVRMVGWQDAADVTQQAFLQALRSIGQFNGRSRIETWLYRLAVNESLQHLRRSRRRRYRVLDWEPMDQSHHGGSAERKELLEQALARIDPELRSIFLLREVEGLSYRDIAEALQIREGTVGSRLNRARRELKKHLSDLGFEL